MGALENELRRHFGHDTFRDGQREVIDALLAGRSALAVFPTGGGKSLCYQLPALMLDGLTLVVSPLIALMKDQVDTLRARGIAAARLDSSLGVEETRAIYQAMEQESLKLLYIAPERFANEAFRLRIRRTKIALAAIDEAHCISEWGHNFRPDYLKLARVMRALRVPRVLALTATATPKVAAEIRKHFRIAEADHIQLSFHRTNLDLRVTPCTASEKKPMLVERLRERTGPAVVYVTRQETAEEVATFLNHSGLKAQAYHAGLADEFRATAQQDFMEGRVDIVVATIAFGMGIDKADIRHVIHYNIPKSLENHTQEIGRAGRDGLPAVCEMFACGDDLIVLENFIHADAPSRRALAMLLDRVLRLGDEFDISVNDLSQSCDIRPTVVGTVLAYLEIGGFIEVTGSFYDTYQIRFLRDEAACLSGMAPAARSLVRSVLDAGEMKRNWMVLRPREISDSLGVKRAKVVAAIGDMEQAGDIAVKISGIRRAYRIKKPAGDIRQLATRLADAFERREKADLDRLAQVLALSGHAGCLTGFLTRHFGEELDVPCGHCDRCRGVPPQVVARPHAREVTFGEWQQIRELHDERHAALGTPRQFARFLSGMSSPATIRGRLTRHDAFGLLHDLPFADILSQVKAL